MWPLPALHVYDDRGAHSPAMNMAIDEALLEAVTAPVLRFYGWRAPAVSFGYFGSYAEVADEERELVRRWTGGGIVPHGDDLTYSVILPRSDREKLLPSRVIYTQIHDAIRAALPIAAALATADAPKTSSACFANPVIADVLVDGGKIAGAAQRRTHRGLLHQGSIQFRNLKDDFRNEFARQLCPAFAWREFDPQWLARAELLAHHKYDTRAWLERV